MYEKSTNKRYKHANSVLAGSIQGIHSYPLHHLNKSKSKVQKELTMLKLLHSILHQQIMGTSFKLMCNSDNTGVVILILGHREPRDQLLIPFMSS